MKLYLDSANLAEIEEAFQWGIVKGLTTTPTFMHRDGITDIDGTILKLSKIVPELQIEALGKNDDEIVAEAERLLSLGLDPEKTVFKIPISLTGAKACSRLRDKGLRVNLHLIYTIQQAYIALSAGASIICPLVGRLQDQGHDALAVIDQCVEAIDRYGYDTEVMFSSVRHPEHVRNALNLGAHICTVPYKVIKQLATNHFTDLGTQEFFEHTRLMTVKVRDAIRTNPSIINYKHSILDALVEMTRSKLGAITIVDDYNNIHAAFTDGDLRRLLEQEGEGALQKKLSDLPSKQPVTIDADQLLYESQNLFKTHKIDTIVVVDNNQPVGMLDIQDLIG